MSRLKASRRDAWLKRSSFAGIVPSVESGITSRVLLSKLLGACRTIDVHRVRQTLAHEYRHFGAPVLLAPVASRIISDRHRLAVSERQYDSPQRNFLLGQVLHNVLGAPLTEDAVRVLGAIGRCESAYFDHESLLGLCLRRELVQRGLSLSGQHCAADLEVDRFGLL